MFNFILFVSLPTWQHHRFNKSDLKSTRNPLVSVRLESLDLLLLSIAHRSSAPTKNMNFTVRALPDVALKDFPPVLKFRFSTRLPPTTICSHPSVKWPPSCSKYPRGWMQCVCVCVCEFGGGGTCRNLVRCHLGVCVKKRAASSNRSHLPSLKLCAR